MRNLPLADLQALGLSPQRVEAVLHRLDIDRIVDTREQGYRFKAAAYWNEDTRRMEATHVTSDPSYVLAKLRAGRDLDGENSYRDKAQELGPGLYVSDRPQLWMGRATAKWSFIARLTPALRARYIAAMQHELTLLVNRHYVSASEAEPLIRMLNDTEKFPDLVEHAALRLAAQPFNVKVWVPEFLGPLGIEAAPQPLEIPVEFEGRFAELKYDRLHHRAAHGILRGLGLDGAFVPGGWSGYPQTVIWTHRAVLRFGDWKR